MIKYAKTLKDHDIEMANGNFLRQVGFALIQRITTSREKLPYPTHLLNVGEDVCEEYEIPKECMQDVLSIVNPLDADEHFKVDDEIFCMIGLRKFKGDDFRVIRFNNFNYLVTPWFFVDGSNYLDCIKVNQS